MDKENDLSNLTVDKIKQLYKNYFNKGQVSLLGKLTFSNEKITQAKGCYITTESGNKLFDMTSGFGTQNLGYNNDEILSTRKDFIDNNKLPFSRLFFDENIAKLSKKMAELLSGNMQYSFFSNSGAEANEGAIKMAYKYHNGERKILIHNKNSFHGKLIATSQITDSPEVGFRFQNSLNTQSLDLQNLDNLTEFIINKEKNIYALIIEPFSASLAEPFSYSQLKKIQEICNKHDILVIYDEVYSGFYRTGSLFYFMDFKDLQPDIVTYSKSFGGGISSIAGYTSKKQVFLKSYGNQKDALLHSSTYSNYVEECAVAYKTLEIFERPLLISSIKEASKMLETEINKLLNIPYVEAITGRGFHFGIEFKKINLIGLDKLIKFIPFGITEDPRFVEKLYMSAVINELYIKHKILSYAGFNTKIKLIVSPPVIINSEEISYIINSIAEVIDQNPIMLISKFIKNYLVK